MRNYLLQKKNIYVSPNIFSHRHLFSKQLFFHIFSVLLLFVLNITITLLNYVFDEPNQFKQWTTLSMGLPA